MHTIPFDRIDPDALLEATRDLEHRIQARFPDAGLRQQAGRLTQIAAKAGPLARRLARPNRLIQFVLFLFVAVSIAGICYGLQRIHNTVRAGDLLSVLKGLLTPEGVQAIQAGTQEVIYLAIVVIAFFKLDKWRRASRICDAIQPLISFAHVVDLRQLTKDPERVGRRQDDNTEASPAFSMSAFELQCYLNYCMDMLALIGKVAALYAQELNERAVTLKVDELEDVLRGLSSKIGNKLILLQMEFGNATRHKDGIAQAQPSSSVKQASEVSAAPA